MRIQIKRLHKGLNATSIFVTQDQVEAMTLADTLIVMNVGCVEQIGSPAEIYRRPATVPVAGFMDDPAINLMPATVGPNGTVTLDGAAKNVAVGQSTMLAGTTLTIGTPQTIQGFDRITGPRLDQPLTIAATSAATVPARSRATPNTISSGVL